MGSTRAVAGAAFDVLLAGVADGERRHAVGCPNGWQVPSAQSPESQRS
jgi:hypothetical protein